MIAGRPRLLRLWLALLCVVALATVAWPEHKAALDASAQLTQTPSTITALHSHELTARNDGVSARSLDQLFLPPVSESSGSQRDFRYAGFSAIVRAARLEPQLRPQSRAPPDSSLS